MRSFPCTKQASLFPSQDVKEEDQTKRIVPIGSSFPSLGTFSSSMDLCFSLRRTSFYRHHDQRTFSSSTFVSRRSISPLITKRKRQEASKDVRTALRISRNEMLRSYHDVASIHGNNVASIRRSKTKEPRIDIRRDRIRWDASRDLDRATGFPSRSLSGGSNRKGFFFFRRIDATCFDVVKRNQYRRYRR